MFLATDHAYHLAYIEELLRTQTSSVITTPGADNDVIFRLPNASLTLSMTSPTTLTISHIFVLPYLRRSGLGYGTKLVTLLKDYADTARSLSRQPMS